VLAPGWTDFDLRVPAQTHDVTSMLAAGDNTLGAIIGGGWYVGPIKGGRHYRGRPALIAQLDLAYADGRIERVVTDEAWQMGGGTVQLAAIYYGERDDARADQPGWDTPGFRGGGDWLPAETRVDTPPIEPARAPPIRVVHTLNAVSLQQPQPNVWIYDFGQNFAGWVRLRASGSSGTELRVRYAEELNPDGTLYTANRGSSAGGDFFTLRGEGTDVFEPRFTYHGFRYVEVTGLPAGVTPTLDGVDGRVVSTDLAPFGSFATSSELVNQIQRLIDWGRLSNYQAVPTDSPQRAERLGWTGDAQAFASTGAFVADVSNYLGNWLVSVRESQRADGAIPDIAPYTGIDRYGTAGWGDAATIVPWALYEQYGDRRVLADNYAMMTRWLAYLQENSTDLLRPAQGYGDWYAPPPTIGGPKGPLTPLDLVATAFFAHSADLTSRTAQVLGMDDDARTYHSLFESVRAAFNRQWLQADGRLAPASQGGYALALVFNLVPDDLRGVAAQHLVDDVDTHDGHLQNGFMATQYVLSVLADNGRPDVAYRVLEQDTYPSWGYELRQGATTPWEQWDGKWPDGRIVDETVSFNHYAQAAIGDFLYRTVGGVSPDPAAPGYQRVVIHPLPGGGLSSASASVESTHGLISTAWRVDGGYLVVRVQLPPNTAAEVHISAGQNASLTESDVPVEAQPGVRLVRRTAAEAVFEIGSGSYRFEVLP
jgi:alpha-L-rhamnosidase